MSEPELADTALESLVEFEGCIPWMYCDRKGLVTVGIGHLLKDAGAAARLPFVRMADSGSTDPDAREFAWAKVRAFFHEGLDASAYRAITDIRLDPAYCRRLARVRLVQEFIPGLQRLFHQFDQWPRPAQLATLDMVYSLGFGKLVSKFVKFVAALQDQNWVAAAAECSRDGARAERNRWTELQFSNAASL